MFTYNTYIQFFTIKISAEIIVRTYVAKIQTVGWLVGSELYTYMYVKKSLLCACILVRDIKSFIISYIFTYIDFGENWLKTCVDIV